MVYAEEKLYVLFLGMPFTGSTNALLLTGGAKQLLTFIDIFCHQTYDSPTRQYLDFEAANTRRTQNFLNRKLKCYSSSKKAKRY